MEKMEDRVGGRRPKYELALTKEEVRCMFEYLNDPCSFTDIQLF